LEAWIEVNLETVRLLDEALLAERVDALVHERFRDDIATWFFFWEPELRLRIRWRDPERVGEHRGELAQVLDAWKSEGTIADWYEGAHGRRGETYAGEADNYGAEIWGRLQLDWMSGSELALALIQLDRAGKLTQPRDYHWQRRVHLFSNQLLGFRQTEIELCLRQALLYAKSPGSPPTPQAKKLITELCEFLQG
jgi:Lantibiotic biosynthesis dehydratase C-term